MKKGILFLLTIIVVLSCWKDDEEWRDRLIGNNKFAGVSDSQSCSDATYPDWQNSPYNLPYPFGIGYNINLGHCGGSYHSTGQPDQFALDFDMSIGQTITAARSGRVVYVEESGIDGGFPNNLVIVDHGDNTYAQYMHLTQNGASVEVGQSISQGGFIGFSGSTGLAGYPHLHFVVTADNYRWPYKSIPVTFKNTDANERSLQEGGFYIAYPN